MTLSLPHDLIRHNPRPRPSLLHPLLFPEFPDCFDMAMVLSDNGQTERRTSHMDIGLTRLMNAG